MKNFTAPIITIDGPGGSGKGTISQMLAKKLKWHFLDSGAIYRVLALYLSRQRKKSEGVSAFVQTAKELPVEFKTSINESRVVLQVILADQDVTEAIRTEECGQFASEVAQIPEVRLALLDRQRAFCKPPGLVADGRDMGTVVFPEAQIKIYLDASAEERAKRRYFQLKQKGINVSLASVFFDIQERDRRDQERAAAPLMPAQGAWILDSTQLTIQEVFDRVCQYVMPKLNLIEAEASSNKV